MVNVENLHLFEPSMLDKEGEGKVLPSVEDFSFKHSKSWRRIQYCRRRFVLPTKVCKSYGRLHSNNSYGRRQNGMRGTESLNCFLIFISKLLGT